MYSIICTKRGCTEKEGVGLHELPVGAYMHGYGWKRKGKEKDGYE